MMHVFFYGTLKRVGANHRVLVDVGARFVAEATTREPRVLVDLGPYPALLPVSVASTTCVAGEVFEIDDATIAALDEFEGVPSLYTRESIALTTTDGRNLTAFVYVLAIAPPPHARPIANGHYTGRGIILPSGASPDHIDDDDP